MPGRQTRAWIVACAGAEALGMTAAAGAARTADRLLVDPGATQTALAWAAVLVAGTIEGLALGVAQSHVLRRAVPRLPRLRYVLATVLVAGLGWAAGSAPSLFSAGADTGSAPPWPLLVVAGALLGVVMGALLGCAQALTIRHAVRRPTTWVLANTMAWTLAMALLMLGASTPNADWPTFTVLCWAALTGAVAGASLGCVLGWFVPSLEGPRPRNRVVLALLRSGHWRRGERSLVGLRVTGRRTGRAIELPVSYVGDGPVLWVAVGRPDRKLWWRNVPSQPAVQVLRHQAWMPAEAAVFAPDAPGYEAARAAYRSRRPRARLGADVPFVRLEIASTPT